MRTILELCCITIFTLFLFAFTSSEQFEGKYGVGTNNPNGIELTINADHTFHYEDASSQDQKINIDGTWKKENNIIFLHSKSAIKFHSKWKLSKDENRISSRKGMTFYSLCKL